MKKFGLIGYPLGHSFSKNYFNEKFHSENIDAEYVNFEIPTIEDFNKVIKANPTICGLNVTIPYKEQVIGYLDELDKDAAAIGAVNVIKIERNKSKVRLIGYNSDVMGFTQSEWDADGNVTSSKMYTEAQELGKNAMFTINGTSMVSTSNTVTSDVSRIQGVTLTLNKVSTEEDGNATLKIEQDTSQLKDAVNEFITAYNDMIAKVDEVTANGADLNGETTLTSLKNTLRNYTTSSNTTNGGIYKLLSDIGITTAAADGNNLSADTSELTLDEEKFLKALEENPDSVKSILAGENGVLTMMENAVEQSLKATVGFFDVKTSTIDSDINSMEEKIKKQQTSVDNYKSQLETKFYKMELAISQMQQNYSSFLS